MGQNAEEPVECKARSETPVSLESGCAGARLRTIEGQADVTLMP